jgi:GNAT superfamily N-acetyltransferase
MALGILVGLFVVRGMGFIFSFIFFQSRDYLGIFIIVGIVVLVDYLLIKYGIETLLLLNPQRKLDRTEKKSSIQSLFVAPAWRRRGLGSALVRRLIQEAPLPLYVDSLPNRVSFYTRLGFVPLRTKSSPSTVVPLVYKIDSGVSSTKRRIN